MLFDLSFLTDFGLLALRLITAIVFIRSGMGHWTDTEERIESFGLPYWVIKILGVVEMAAGVSLALGIYIQIGAALIIFTMLGAIQKTIFKWKKGFFVDEGKGWHYNLIFISIAILLLGIGGGEFVLN